jgi:hypothetical protein
MAWYWIILLIVGYILMSVITGAIVIREIGAEESAMLGILWPIVFPMLLVLIISRWIYLKLFS